MIGEAVRPTKRRPKAGAWAVLGALVLLVVLVIRAVGGGGGYREEALGLARATTRLGQQVAALRGDLPRLDRLTLLRRLRQWSRAAAHQRDLAVRLVPPQELRLAGGYLVAALGLRAEALRRFDPAVRNALSDQDIQVAVGQLVRVMRDLVVADRNYERFRAAWPHGARPPPGRWVTDESEATVEGVTNFVRALRRQPALEVMINLRVAGMEVVPKPLAREGEVDVLPFARALEVTVVVENAGNQLVPSATVAATLTSETEPEPQAAEGRAGPLRPGERRPVVLRGLVPTAGGPKNLLRVTVGPVGGERNTLDNSREYTFTMRRP